MCRSCFVASVRYVSDRASNPFGIAPPCDPVVPGFGDADADFHVIGAHPGVHGGETTGVPFTERPWSARFFDALVAGGLVERFDPQSGDVVATDTFLSYLHPCVPDEGEPDDDAYAALEPYFDAELRAITADVLLPVGARATEHVLTTYTARDPGLAAEMERLHATEVAGSGWLVVPVLDPAAWTDDVADRLVETLRDVRSRDYRRTADLGRFLGGSDPYYVR